MSYRETGGESGLAVETDPHQPAGTAYDGHVGIELIYKSNPKARVFYSSSPAIQPHAMRGAGLTPDCPEDDLDTSLDKMQAALAVEPDDSPRIDVPAVWTAVLYMRSEREKRLPLERRSVDPSLLDTQLALDGLCWIKSNVDPDFGGSLHEAATEYRRQLNGARKPCKPAATTPAGGKEIKSAAGLNAAEYQAERSKEERKRAKRERRARHQADRQAEFELLQAWLEENQPAEPINELVQTMQMVDSRLNSDATIDLSAKKQFYSRLHSRLEELAEDPSMFWTKFSDSELFEQFFAQNDAPILRDIYNFIGDEELDAWKNQYCDSPQKFKQIAARWLDVFGQFNDEYKEQALQNNFQSQDADLTEKSDEYKTSDATDSAGRWFLYNSLAAIARKRPKQYVSTAHDIANMAFDTEDEFTAKMVLGLIYGVSYSSPEARILLTHTQRARATSEEEKFQAADLLLAIDQLNNQLTQLLQGEDRANSLPPKIKRRYANIFGPLTAAGVMSDFYELSSPGDSQSGRSIYGRLQDL